MEQLLHYVWKHKLWPLHALTTTDDRLVEVIDPGLYNRRNAGPDFFNAKVRIGSTLWVGNVEIHTNASDWYAHGHDRDSAYDNVVLHVVGNADVNVKNSRGDYLPQMVLEVPSAVKEHYEELLHTDQYPPCYSIIPNLSRLLVHSWMAALQTERLEQKTEAIRQRAERGWGFPGALCQKNQARGLPRRVYREYQARKCRDAQPGAPPPAGDLPSARP